MKIRIFKYQIGSAFTAMIFVILFVQFFSKSLEEKSALSIIVFIKALILVIFNSSFYFILIKPKSFLLALASFTLLSSLDLAYMIFYKSSIGVKLGTNISKSAFILLTILNLIFSIICWYRLRRIKPNKINRTNEILDEYD